MLVHDFGDHVGINPLPLCQQFVSLGGRPSACARRPTSA